MKALGAHLYTNFPSVGYHVIFAAKSSSRLIQAMYVTSLGCLCPKPASFEIFLICLYVCMSITEIASISWPSNQGPFGCSQSIQNYRYTPKGNL